MIRLLTAFATLSLSAAPSLAADPLLEDAISFSGQIFHLQTEVPGLVIAGVRGGESAVFGFGEVAEGSGRVPDGDTDIAVGSISKSITGLALAHLVADGTVALTDPVAPYVAIVDAMPERDGHAIRFVDLATQSSGLPRELAPADGVAKYSDASFAANLRDDALLFAPGTGVLYSNVGFDVLSIALAGAAKTPFADLVKAKVFDPLKMDATGYAEPTGDNAFTGYDWTGAPIDPDAVISNQFGASSVHTTANDMVKYLKWNLDRFGAGGAEARALSHAAHLIRDGLDPVYGMDESGHMDAMGLGWVIMMPEGDRPLIIQKAGGTNGIFSYLAFAPTRGVGVFISINKFDFAASVEMAAMVNGLIATLAPR
ncbi:serine hydrolase [Acuticoccus mangrovi]|uniref:Serine hydrolase n=1 Tax=Acuticoccus mangrovi TaxID=2796142 RepID=A0A934ID49_9HYPH|nr:serine hydrolase [Acuticoccus mangrovi]MBJ3774334.1 serine hydrolase [Acuticoccus mangrovi]